MFRILPVILLVLISGTGCVHNQGTSGNTAYPVPAHIPLDAARWLIPDQLYLIGWSDDGKLAYVNEPGDEACGCYFMNLYIQDAVQHKTLYHYHFTNEQAEKMSAENDNLAAIWKLHEKEFTDSLTRYHIRPGNYILASGHKTKTKQGEIYASVAGGEKMNEDFSCNTIPAYRVLLHSSAGVMPLYTSTQEQQEEPLLNIYPAAMITEVSGHFAAVVTAGEYRGWEGPPNTLRYQVYTCQLN